MASSLRPQRYARTAVDLFALLGYVASLVFVGKVVVDAVRFDRSGSVTHVLYIQYTFEAFALTYRGHGGTWLAAAEFILAGGSLVLALRGRDGLRRLGVIGALAWTMLWLGNAVAALIILPSEPLIWIHAAFVGPPGLAALYAGFVRLKRDASISLTGPPVLPTRESDPERQPPDMSRSRSLR